MSKQKEKNAKETISERINKRLIEPIQIRNTNPSILVLIKGRKGDKDNEQVFNGYQSSTMKIQDVLNIATNTILFKGEDGNGKHASLYIEDAEVRQYLGFETINDEGEVIPQEILDKDTILNILSDPDEGKFEEMISSFKNKMTRIRLLEDVIKKSNYNDARRVKYIEKFLDFNMKL